MMITQAQQENIKEILWHNLKFRETFDELYDHILTSIERTETDDKLPYEIATDIIKNEFGGWEKLKELETSRQKDVQKYLRNKLWRYMKSYFRFPLIAFTLLALGSFYYAADHLPRKVILLFLFCTMMVPFIMWCRIAPINRWSKKYKASIKENIGERIGTLGFSFFNCFMFIPQLFADQEGYSVINHVHASVLALAVVVYITYSLSAIKIFQEDLKVSLVS